MADKTGISWTDATWSPVVGCSRVSEGCRNCYSERLVATRLRHTEKYSGLAQMTQAGPRWTNVVRCAPDALIQPLRWVNPKRIFVNSMSDTFHKDVPTAFLDRMFIVMALGWQHTFQVLTKRPERMAEYMADPDLPARMDEEYGRWASEATESAHQLSRCRSSFMCRVQRDEVLWPLPNVWVGTSVEDQAAADARIPHLLNVPAKVRFLSCEPLLGPVDLTAVDFGGIFGETNALNGKRMPGGERLIHWVIAGGESGPNARPMHPDWARSLRDQCAAAGVPFHFKQWGEFTPTERREGVTYETFTQIADVEDRTYPIERLDERTRVWKVGVKRAGRSLDDVLHDAFPEVARGR